MVWVVWWVGLAYVSALVGNVWALINPLKTIFEWADRLYRLGDVKGELSFRCRYPDQLGVWPGVLLFLVFAWVEIVYGEAAIPSRIAQLMVAYSLIPGAECSSLARTNGYAEERLSPWLLAFWRDSPRQR